MRIRRAILWQAAAGAVFAICAIALQPVSVAAPGCGWGKFSGGRPPGACWRPFSEKSPFNRRLPAAPAQTVNSTLIAQTVGSWGSGPMLIAGMADTPDDFSHPIYFSSRSNPVYRINCVEYGGECPIDGARVRIPRQARPAAGGDAHLAVIDQAKGWEYDLWHVAPKPVGGGHLDIGWGGRTRIGTDKADGLGAGATAAGFALSAGVIRPAELRSGQINHALFMTVPCTSGHSVYPAGPGVGTKCDDQQLPGSGLPAMGQHVYLGMTAGEIDGLPLARWQKAILHAMATYGMFIGDTGGSGWGIEAESGSSQTSFGRSDPWVRLARRIGIPSYVEWDGTTRYTFDMRGVIDWSTALRVADPCVSRGRC
jgi:hypothetical protein